MHKLLQSDISTSFSSFTPHDISEFLLVLDAFYLELRPILFIPKNITFGHEIEYRNCNRHEVDTFISIYHPSWCSKIERAISDFNSNPYLGGEVSSPVFTNKENTYQELSSVCIFLSLIKKATAINTGAHIHIGADIFPEEAKYLIRLTKLWTAYEDIIYRFGYGEYSYARSSLTEYCAPVGNTYKEIYNQRDINENSSSFLAKKELDLGKEVGLNMSNIADETKINTIEIRCPNGTLNEAIIQNNLNFFVHLFLYALSDNYDEELINRRMQERNFYIYDNQVYLAKAFELADLIFTNNYDKMCFLKQYYKQGETYNIYQLTRSLTKRKTIY